jgi:hypothetical protein
LRGQRLIVLAYDLYHAAVLARPETLHVVVEDTAALIELPKRRALLWLKPGFRTNCPVRAALARLNTVVACPISA